MPDWEEILRRDGPAVWRTAYRLLGNRSDAEDCFQETFLAAVKVSRREPVRHWRSLLVRLAATRAIDRLRRRRTAGRGVDWDAVPGRAQSPEQSAEDAELSDRLRDALAGIPGRQAEVFCLHCLEGWSYEEIAAQLGLSANAVGVLLHRARKRLRELLAGAFAAPPGPHPKEPP